MPTQYSDVADIFEKVVDFLELEGENLLRIRPIGMPPGPWEGTSAAWRRWWRRTKS
jgi:hypothetical protein